MTSWERDWVMDVGAAYGSWELAESPSYDLRALKAEYDSTFRKGGRGMTSWVVSMVIPIRFEVVVQAKDQNAAIAEARKVSRDKNYNYFTSECVWWDNQESEVEDLYEIGGE